MEVLHNPYCGTLVLVKNVLLWTSQVAQLVVVEDKRIFVKFVLNLIYGLRVVITAHDRILRAEVHRF